MWNELVFSALVKTSTKPTTRGKYLFYLPQHHVDESWTSGKINDELIMGLLNSQAVVANLDGPGGDDGTCWEMGFMTGRSYGMFGIGTIPWYKQPRSFWYRTDFRRGGDSEQNVNLMMAHSAPQIELDDLTPEGVAQSIIRTLDDCYYPETVTNDE